MSWLSSGLQDIGLGGLNTFWNTAIEPALENPIVDIGLGLGATALTAGLAGPALGGLFGASDVADIAGGAAASGGDVLSLAPSLSAADAAVTPLGFAGDVGASGDLTSFLTDPGAAAGGYSTITGAGSPIAAATPGGYAPGGFALSTGLSGDVSGGAALPDLGSAAASVSPSGSVPSDLGFVTDAGDVTNPATVGVANATTGAPVSGAATQPSGFLSSFTNALSPTNIGANVGKALANPLTDLGIAGLGYNLYQGYQEKQAIGQATNLAKQEAATAQQTQQQASAAAQPFIVNGQSLTQYLSTGTLPPDWQAQVTQAVNGAKAQIIQGYATRGMSTDPNQNSALAQDLANVDLQSNTLTASLESTLSTAGNQMVQTANGLLQTGLSAAQISAELPAMMLQLTNQLNQSTATALAGFASAVGRTGQGSQLTLNVNPSTGQVTA